MTDDDLLALITDEVNQPVVLWSLLDLQVAPTSHSVVLTFEPAADPPTLVAWTLQ